MSDVPNLSEIDFDNWEGFSPLIIGKIIVGHVCQIHHAFILENQYGLSGDWICVRQDGKKSIIPQHVFGIYG